MRSNQNNVLYKNQPFFGPWICKDDITFFALNINSRGRNPCVKLKLNYNRHIGNITSITTAELQKIQSIKEMWLGDLIYNLLAEVRSMWVMEGQWPLRAIISSPGILFCTLKIYSLSPRISGLTSSTLFSNAMSIMAFLKQTFQVVVGWLSHQSFSVFFFNLEDNFSYS